MAIRVSQTGIIVEYTVDDHAIRVSQTGVIVDRTPEQVMTVSQAGIETAWNPLPPRQVAVSQGGIEVGQQPYETSILVSMGGIEVGWIPTTAYKGNLFIYQCQLGNVAPTDGVYVYGCRLGTGDNGEDNIFVNGVNLEM